MARAADPTDPIRKAAVMFPGVAKGTSCNQSSFKAGKSSFLFIGPGAKGQGFKAMFKLDRSMPQAKTLAAEAPDRFEVGSTGWVTTRFSGQAPLPKSIWAKWLRESYDLACGVGVEARQTSPRRDTKSKAKRSKATRSKAARSKAAPKR
jgi:hypothetical protein